MVSNELLVVVFIVSVQVSGWSVQLLRESSLVAFGPIAGGFMVQLTIGNSLLLLPLQ
jgi:hypothetical protein